MSEDARSHVPRAVPSPLPPLPASPSPTTLPTGTMRYEWVRSLQAATQPSHLASPLALFEDALQQWAVGRAWAQRRLDWTHRLGRLRQGSCIDPEGEATALVRRLLQVRLGCGGRACVHVRDACTRCMYEMHVRDACTRCMYEMEEHGGNRIMGRPWGRDGMHVCMPCEEKRAHVHVISHAEVHAVHVGRRLRRR